ncbi:MAG: mobile mystery protein A [Actinobacteria bacterium]|nr:mobile mystery protein A [Actinomycetota bacterium]
MKRESRVRDRRTLDNRLNKLPKKEEFAVPPQGWIKSIREALGMSAADLGNRMGIARQSVLTLEESESQGRAGMDSLNRAAEALDCTFIYGFIPNSSLESILRNQVVKIVDQSMGTVSHSMKLEDQATKLTDSAYEDLVTELMNSPKVWHSMNPKQNSK